MAQEVFGPSIFIEAADEIGDGMLEFFFRRNRAVEEHLACELLDDAPNVVGHPFEHLEDHIGFHLIFKADQHRKGDVEEVVARDAEAHRARIFWKASVNHHALIVCIDFDFGSVRSLRPAS